MNFDKNVLGYILGDFFTNSSGHHARKLGIYWINPGIYWIKHRIFWIEPRIYWIKPGI
jgi:hypothetical protein